MSRKQSCEVLDTGLDYSIEQCITWRGRPGAQPLKSAEDAVRFLFNAFDIQAWDREKFLAVVCNARLQPLAVIELFNGGVGSSIVDPVYAFRRILQVPTATAVFFAHNHPSGATSPSMDDQRLNLQLEEGARAIKLRICDHLILTPDGDWFATSVGAGKRISRSTP